MTNWKEIQQEWETSKITLNDLADKHDVKIGTLKSRKHREAWQKVATSKDATSNKRLQPSKNNTKSETNSRGPKKRSGNPNPSQRFPKRNDYGKTHGFFSKFLPDDTLEIMEAMNERSPADLIWDQIQIQYAAIIRAQRIMHVTDKDEMIKELKKSKYDFIKTGEGKDAKVERVAIEEEYEFQFAWERHAQLLTAQSRAITELRTSINHFVKLADEVDERRLKLEQMQLNIDKTKVEIEKLGNDEQTGPIEIKIIGKKRD